MLASLIEESRLTQSPLLQRCLLVISHAGHFEQVSRAFEVLVINFSLFSLFFFSLHSNSCYFHSFWMAVLLAAMSVCRDQQEAKAHTPSFVAVAANSSQRALISSGACVSSNQMQGMGGLKVLVMTKIQASLICINYSKNRNIPKPTLHMLKYVQCSATVHC